MPQLKLTASPLTAANGVPTLATDGKKLRGPGTKNDEQFWENQIAIGVRSTAGSGTMTATVNVWVYDAELGFWWKLQSLNGGTAIPETGTDVIRYIETVDGFAHFDRIYVELAAIAGTATAVDFYIMSRTPRPGVY